MPETLQQFDATLFLMVNGAHHPVADLFFRIVTHLGSGWVAGVVLAAIVVPNIRREGLVRVLLCGTIGLAGGGIINSQIKHLVQRERPAVYFSNHSTAAAGGATVTNTATTASPVRLLGPAYRSRSFPSGHTNTAFASATLLAFLFGGWWWCAFVAALAVGYSRIYLGVHFPVDVAAGAMLGSAVMVLVMWWSGCLGRRFSRSESHAQQ